MQQEIVNCLTWLNNNLVSGYIYDKTNDQIVRKEAKESYEAFYKEVAKFIDFKKITREDAIEMRFKKWDETLPHLWLFPLWLYPIIPEGLTVYDLDGNPFEFKKDTSDTDARMGCLSYGIMIDGIDMPLTKKEEKKAEEDNTSDKSSSESKNADGQANEDK